MPDLAALVLQEFRDRFAAYRRSAEAALAQADDDAFFATLDAESNPLALQVKHLAGNFRSRWTDFLTTDGEKPDRERDREFVLEDGDTREALMARWAESWSVLEATLDALTPGDLTRAVTIRGEAHGVVEALSRGLTHTAYHVGQIVLL
ncbi:MAG TPA: DUF1572 family protein, partial [Anaeromyxobacteraceae bacterium]|nr:DUF1572 family protein [Anaeromyxobacteraceae bacterium]